MAGSAGRSPLLQSTRRDAEVQILRRMICHTVIEKAPAPVEPNS